MVIYSNKLLKFVTTKLNYFSARLYDPDTFLLTILRMAFAFE